jgi:hypothetical protein
MSIRFLLCSLCVVGLCVARGASAAGADAPVPERIDFNRDVRPILSENCFACHGPDKGKRKAGLRLDTREGLFTAIEGRHPAVAGKPGESEIYKRVVTKDDDERMPDPKSGKTLSPREIAVITRWIEQGAEFKGHWAYIKPVREAVPNVKDQIANPIDAFLLAKLGEQRLTFSKEADRVTLVRRLYLDLLGLPPTTEQVDAFVKDASPGAYERLVDQLLANPHFGERMAVYWLDLVRFADTIGYHSDNPRDITPYRDWVINAFNRNEPFDQFTIEQLAGDLLPNPTVAQRVASGYNRLLQTTEEGGAQPKEYAAKYNADRVRNFASVWMAATMGCCECHDHKFDPYTAKDFYSMAAFFADVAERPVGKREAGMPVPDERQAVELAKLEAAVALSRRGLERDTPEVVAAREAWEKSLGGKPQAEWQVLTPTEAASAAGNPLKINKDGSIVATGKSVADVDTYFVTARTNLKGVTAVRIEALADKSLPKNGPGRADNGNFVLTEILVQARPAASGLAAGVKLQNASATIEQGSFADPNPYKVWTPAAAIDGDAKGANWGWAVLDKNNTAGRDEHAVFETAADLGDGGETSLTFVLRQNHGAKHLLGKFRLAVTTAARPVRAGKAMPAEVVAALAAEPAKRSDAQKNSIAAYFRTITPLLEPVRAELAARERTRDAYAATLRRSLVTVAEAPKVVRVLPRGNWNTDSGEIVQPAVPAFLRSVAVPTEAGTPAKRLTRLDLARWVVSRENPLTARVMVNRLWKMFYGTGLSKSLEDLGSQGEWPTHPELLDWLACEFQEGGWDVKHMVRLMVTSRAYRQTSYGSPELKETDPFNRLLARQAAFRLDAEFVRDNALAVSGLLVDRIGGESVKPYQPAGYWEFLNFPVRTYVHDKGENEYRRGIYTHWQRSFLHPSLLNFDAPTREECTAARVISNTPQQALTLLNDPTYVEAARVFAERILTAGGAGDVPDRLRYAWRTALGREPRAEEIAVLAELYAKHRAEYAADARAAEAIASAGEAPRAKGVDVAELAAWTSVSRAILNLHETITRN